MWTAWSSRCARPWTDGRGRPEPARLVGRKGPARRQTRRVGPDAGESSDEAGAADAAGGPDIAAAPPPLALPEVRDWAGIGIRLGVELSGGFQSRVFSADVDGPAVVKLTDARLVARAPFERRVEIVDLLARQNEEVVGPQRHRGVFVNRLGGWLVVVTRFVDGRVPDIGRPADAIRMGRALARLHRTMAPVATGGVPDVAAFAALPTEATGLALGRAQLIHGDFAASNLRLRDDGVRLDVLDLDDCGTGPVAFDVGNALYMVLFDATIDATAPRYEPFREWFVSGYRDQAEDPVDDAMLDAVIDLRRAALRHWLDHPSEAPIGIRMSPPAWRTTLRWFADHP
jgi:Ser/Thr protein kinase RdoA (MazF antagonist)